MGLCLEIMIFQDQYLMNPKINAYRDLYMAWEKLASHHKLYLVDIVFDKKKLVQAVLASILQQLIGK